MELENSERIMLRGLVKEQIKKASTETQPCNNGDKKTRKKYGIRRMTTLYELLKKLSKKSEREV